MQEAIARLRDEGLSRIARAETVADLAAIRVALLGRKVEVTVLLRRLKDSDPATRPVLGAALNQLKLDLGAGLARRETELAADVSAPAVRDLTLPGVPPATLGTAHPLPSVLEEICDIFYGMGYDRDDGPEVELDYYNFTALNFPHDHPARDIQDTFFLGPEILLRTQTSPVQVRVMQHEPPPIYVIAPGFVYRRDDVDATHSPMFQQMEGLAIDEGLTLAHLKGTMLHFARTLLGADRQIRLRPHFFPFTEPSVEVEVSHIDKHGRTIWLELAGAGMVDPNVLEAGGIDPERYTGFAFGWGLDRIAMVRFGVPDLRYMYEGDLRVLEQFA
jgi:phenylalanyl-tRNA synthetase alpha chain